MKVASVTDLRNDDERTPKDWQTESCRYKSTSSSDRSWRCVRF